MKLFSNQQFIRGKHVRTRKIQTDSKFGKFISRDDVNFDHLVYGKDRHNSEVLTFYLSSVLQLHETPIVIGRKISREEIIEAAANKKTKRTVSEFCT